MPRWRVPRSSPRPERVSVAPISSVDLVETREPAYEPRAAKRSMSLSVPATMMRSWLDTTVSAVA